MLDLELANQLMNSMPSANFYTITITVWLLKSLPATFTTLFTIDRVVLGQLTGLINYGLELSLLMKLFLNAILLTILCAKGVLASLNRRF